MRKAVTTLFIVVVLGVLGGCTNILNAELPESLVVVFVDQPLSRVTIFPSICPPGWEDSINNHDDMQNPLVEAGLMVTFHDVNIGTHCIMVSAPEGFEDTAWQIGIGGSGGIFLPMNLFARLRRVPQTPSSF